MQRENGRNLTPMKKKLNHSEKSKEPTQKRHQTVRLHDVGGPT